MKMQILPLTLVAALALAACQKEDHTIVAGGEPEDPMANELAEAPPIDASMVPQMVGSDDYRCSGSNALIGIDWIKTGEELTARVTPKGEAGITFTQADDGSFTTETEGATLSGSPEAASVTFNGTSCKK